MPADDRLTKMLQSANSGTKVTVPATVEEEDSFDLDDDETATDGDGDAALPDGEDDTTDTPEVTEDTSAEPDGESDETPETDEDAGDGEPSEDVDTEEGQEEEVEEPQAPAPDPQAATIAALQQQVAFMSNMILGQQQHSLAAPPVSGDDDLPDMHVRGAIFGGDPKVFEALPEDTKRRVVQVYERYTAAETRYAKNPALRYEEQIRDRVRQEIEAAVKPLREDLEVREADRLITRHLAPLGDEAHPLRVRAMQIFGTLPGSKGGWAEREKVLATAVILARAERLGRQTDAAKKSGTAKKVQAKAAGGGKLKGSLPKSGNKSSGKLPEMGDNESPKDYARRIAKFSK